MPKGYSGKILRINLTEKRVETQDYNDEFYRLYLGGGGIGTYFLLKETGAAADPLGPENIITLAPGLTTGPAVTGVSRSSATALAPETGAVGDSQAGGNFGPFLKRCGFDAVVITGRSEKPCYIHIENGGARIEDAGAFSGKTILEAHDLFTHKFSSAKVSIVQCGPAGEKLVRCANLASDLNNFYGRTGLGAVFGSKNLRAVVASGSGSLDFADPENLKALAKTGASRVAGSGFVSTLKQYGTPGLVEGNAHAGNLCTHNYTTGFHPDHMKMDGSTLEKGLASKGTTCYGCVVGCRKTIKAEGPYQVTDRLGGPEFETLGVLGSNLDILDPVTIGKANELCNNYGLDTITLGGIIAYLFESLEKGQINTADLGFSEDFGTRGFGNGPLLLALIEAAARREGIGEILAEGFEAAIGHFGEATRENAVQVKNHGFAVHMTQVKPAMALMYAVSPIGADHMSCEHDWLLTDNGEGAKGLGITIPGEAKSTGLDKVRMVVYTQYYYSVLDSLGLCMFCWGAGSLYTYPELEVLVKSVTGLDMTFWELMKAGERRINMMRQLNLRRGLSSRNDRLPEKVFRPIPDGPSAGRKVDREAFGNMVSLYYGLMGWDGQGVPGENKLKELGLEWTA